MTFLNSTSLFQYDYSLYQTKEKNLKKTEKKADINQMENKIFPKLLDLQRLQTNSLMTDFLTFPPSEINDNTVKNSELAKNILSSLKDVSLAIRDNYAKNIIYLLTLMMSKITQKNINSIDFEKKFKNEIAKSIDSLLENNEINSKQYEFLQKLVEAIKDIVSFGSIVSGTVASTFLSLPAIVLSTLVLVSELQKLITGDSFVDDIINTMDNKIVNPFINEMGNFIATELTHLGINSDEAKKIGNDVAEIASILLVMGTTFYLVQEKGMVNAKIAELLTHYIDNVLKKKLNADIEALISFINKSQSMKQISQFLSELMNKISEEINTACPHVMQPLLKEIESTIASELSFFDKNILADISDFEKVCLSALQQFEKTGTFDISIIMYALQNMESHLIAEAKLLFNRMLHNVNKEIIDDIIDTAKNDIVNAVTALVKRVERDINPFLPAQIEQLEKDIGNDICNFVNSLSPDIARFSTDLADILTQFEKTGIVNTQSLQNLFASLDKNVTLKLETLLSNILNTTNKEVIDDIINWIKSDMDNVLRKLNQYYLPDSIKLILDKIEEKIDATGFDKKILSYLYEFKNKLISLLNTFEHTGRFDINALSIEIEKMKIDITNVIKQFLAKLIDTKSKNYLDDIIKTLEQNYIQIADFFVTHNRLA